VILYDIFAEGCHTPRTREQIAELFHAGRLKRNDPCKLAVKSTWQTVDELFPLLKYDSAGQEIGPPRESRARLDLIPIVAACAAVIALGIVFAVVALRNRNREIATAAFGNRNYLGGTARVSGQSAATLGNPINSFQAPIANQQARIAREQLQREQAARADQMRAELAREERERQKAAGRNVLVPFDQPTVVDVGKSSVTVKVHDNDVTSFDVWVDGNWHRGVVKQKGISGSRTDETLIYSNARTSLYYVWEISGELNHCILRVRDE
jgi:hypothetical protein